MSVATRAPIQLHALQVTFLLDEHDTGGQSTVFVTRVPAGAFVPPPTATTGSTRRSTSSRGPSPFAAMERSVSSIPAMRCSWVGARSMTSRNAGNVDSMFLSVATPSVFTPAYFHEVAEVLDRSPDGPPDPGALMAVMTRHGLTLAPPMPQNAAPGLTRSGLDVHLVGLLSNPA